MSERQWEGPVPLLSMFTALPAEDDTEEGKDECDAALACLSASLRRTMMFA